MDAIDYYGAIDVLAWLLDDLGLMFSATMLLRSAMLDLALDINYNTPRDYTQTFQRWVDRLFAHDSLATKSAYEV